MPFGTDQILWYNNGVWGRLGYAVPNFGNDPTSLNSSVAYLVDAIGRNLFGIMFGDTRSSLAGNCWRTMGRLRRFML